MKHAISKLDIDQLKPYLLFYLVTKYIGEWKVDDIRFNIVPGKYTFQKFSKDKQTSKEWKVFCDIPGFTN